MIYSLTGLTPCHAKDRFTGFRYEEVGSRGSPEKLQNFTNDHRLLIVAAVIWPKYCGHGLKHYIINQSLNGLRRIKVGNSIRIKPYLKQYAETYHYFICIRFYAAI